MHQTRLVLLLVGAWLAFVALVCFVGLFAVGGGESCARVRWCVFAASALALLVTGSVPIASRRAAGKDGHRGRHLVLTVVAWAFLTVGGALVAWDSEVLDLAVWPALSAFVGLAAGIGLLVRQSTEGEDARTLGAQGRFIELLDSIGSSIVAAIVIIAILAGLAVALFMLWLQRASVVAP